MVVWTFTEIIRACVVGLLGLVVVGFILYGIGEYIIHKLASCGDGADYSCEVSDKPYERINKGRMVKSYEPIWRRCNKFEK